MESSGKPHQCEICLKRYTTTKTLMVHKKLHNEDRTRRFSCLICGKTFFNPQSYEKHLAQYSAEKKYECNICNTLFAHPNHLKQHVTNVHSGIKPFSCDICQRLFPRKADLTNHRRIHTNERPFDCTQCNKSFKQASNLRTHIKTVHNKEALLQCPECPSRYSRLRLLIYHICAKHKSCKPLMCSFCGKRFSYPQTFKNHIKNTCKSKPIDGTIEEQHNIPTSDEGLSFTQYQTNEAITESSHLSSSCNQETSTADPRSNISNTIQDDFHNRQYHTDNNYEYVPNSDYSVK